MSLEQKRRAEQLYHKLGLDPVVNAVLKDFSSSLSGIDRVLDKIFGPYDIKGRAVAVAKQTALITYTERSKEYHKEVDKLEAQIESLKGELAQVRANYDKLMKKVANIVGGDYDELKANYYKLNDKLANLEDLKSQITMMIQHLDKEKAQLVESYESLIAGRDLQIGGLETEKTNLTTELERLKSSYKELRVAITALVETIPHDKIRKKLEQELHTFVLRDSKKSDTFIDVRGKSDDLKKYLGAAAVKGAEEAIRYAEQSLQRIMKNGIDKLGIQVTLYTQNEVITGIVYHFLGERLSDLLNGISEGEEIRGSTFLELSNVDVRHKDGSKESLPTAQIEKENINMAVLANINAARGVGANFYPKSFPFIRKTSVPITLRMADYVLNGSIHCGNGQKPQDVLDEDPNFLPLTDVFIHPLKSDTRLMAPFIAVNKKQVFPLEQPDVSPNSLLLLRAFRRLVEIKVGVN